MVTDSLLKLRRKRRFTTGAKIETPRSAVVPPMHLIAYGPDAFVEKDIHDPKEMAPFLETHAVTWLNVDDISHLETIKAIGETLKLHPLALEDVSELHQRAKAETYGTYLYIVAQMINPGDNYDQEQLSLFFGHRFVLTFQEFPGDCFEPLRERLRKGQGLLRKLGPDYLAYALIDRLIDSYFPILERYGDRIDALEEQSLLGLPSQRITELHRLKRELFSLRRAVWPLRDALGSWMRDASSTDPMGDETKLHLRDAYDHVVQIIDLLETYRELSSDLIDLHLASVNNRMNEVMRVLTIIGAIFMPATFIASVYGMNFKYMPELDWPWGYPYALGLMALFMLLMVCFFWRRGWLKSFYPSNSRVRPSPIEPADKIKPN